MASNTRDSLKNNRPKEVTYIGTVYNFLKVNQEGKIVGGCMDFDIYTVVPFESNAYIPQYHPDGTLVIRKSGEYHKSEKVISITTTNDSMKITTENEIFYLRVNNFLREIRDGEEKTGEINGGTGITLWTQDERFSI